MKKVFYLIVLFAAVFIVSCKKKDKTSDGNGITGPSNTGSGLDLMRDSVFLYAKEAYYWYDALPSYASFNPRSYTGSSD
jgi:carboxyl-terminal processing protease